MKLINVSISNFGSIKEQQNIKINDGITTLIGLNESGKTTILSAIYKLNGEMIKNDEKNRHNDYKNKSSEIIGSFLLSDEDLDNIEKNNPLIKMSKKNSWMYKVHIKDKDNIKYFSMYCNNDVYNMGEWMIKKNLLNKIDEIAKDFDIDIIEFVKKVREASTLAESFRSLIEQFQQINNDFYEKLLDYEELIKWWNYMPKYKIIKFDNKSILGDSIEVVNIEENLQAKNFFKIANIDIENYSNMSANDKADIEKNCEVKISERFNEIFRQNDQYLKFIVKFDDNKVYFFVVDSTSDNNCIPLSKRSDGFDWYFSIYLTLYDYLKNDVDKTFIMLFDEPNLYLNPSAQNDLLNRVFKEEFKGSQIIYSTHSPYMIDSNDFKSVRIIEKKNETKVFNNIPEYNKENNISNNEVDLLTPIFTALQLSVSNDLILNNDCIPILVEGLEDHYMLKAMIKKTGYEEKMKRFRIIPCIGADKVSVLYSYLFGMGYSIVVLVDGDKKGKQNIEKLKKDLKDIDNLQSMLLTYNVVFDKQNDIKLENLLNGEDSKLVNHNSTLTYKTFFDNIDSWDLEKETIENFKKLFDKILELMPK